MARLLSADSEALKKMAGEVIWVDEAGLLSVPDLKKVLSLARNSNARVVLSGDTRQHSPIGRGQGLKLLEESGRLGQTHLFDIKRQVDPEYRKAVDLISSGSVADGFEVLDKMGVVKEFTEDKERLEAIAKEYIKLGIYGKSSLVVTPTHREGMEVSQYIRSELKNGGRLEMEDRFFPVLKNQNLTEAEKGLDMLGVGDLIQFHSSPQNILDSNGFMRDPSSFRTGEVYIYEQEKSLRNGVPFVEHFIKDFRGSTQQLPEGLEKHYSVLRAENIPVSVGEKIRLTDRAKLDRFDDLEKGKELIVSGFEGGRIQTQDINGNSYNLPKNFAQFNHDYYTTSYSSQGRTVDHIILSQSTDSLPATDSKGFYVGVSRGREGISVYTDDKAVLKEAVGLVRGEMSATGLLKEGLKEKVLKAEKEALRVERKNKIWKSKKRLKLKNKLDKFYLPKFPKFPNHSNKMRKVFIPQKWMNQRKKKKKRKSVC